MRKTWVLWLLALLIFLACSPSGQIQGSVALALTQTQAAKPTLFPTFTPQPTRTKYPTLTPLGGGSLPVSSTPAPPEAGSPAPEETETTPDPLSTSEGPPTSTPTLAIFTPTFTPGPGGYPPPASPTSGAPYPAPQTNTPPVSLTPSLTPTPTIDVLFTPSLTPSSTITPTPTVSQTPNPNFTSTASLTPTGTTTATRTPTPTRTTGPSPTPTRTLTPTPALPELIPLILDSDDLNGVANLWVDPPKDVTGDLEDLEGEVCEVTCIGLRWTSLDGKNTLVLTAYRTKAFEQAAQVAYGSQVIYLAQGFKLETLPSGINLPIQSWVGSKGSKDVVIFSSQGPAVVSLFWHSDFSLNVPETVALLAAYMDIQTERLLLNGYYTINPYVTPPP